MDIGKFKSSRGKLTLWVLIPPVLATAVGLSSHALKLQSEWKLNRTEVVAEVLPKLANSQDKAMQLVNDFFVVGETHIRTEDELISFLQSAAGKADFVVDSIKVERRSSVSGGAPVLIANVKGSGGYDAIGAYLGDVTSKQQLLNTSALQVSQGGTAFVESVYRASITFELVLLKRTHGGRTS